MTPAIPQIQLFCFNFVHNTSLDNKFARKEVYVYVTSDDVINSLCLVNENVNIAITTFNSAINSANSCPYSPDTQSTNLYNQLSQLSCTKF